MIPATIATAVAPETITKVTRLFNNTAHDVICELLQNARRADATSVAVSIITQDGASFLEIVDDGRGIDDPSSLGTLGRSGWSDAMRAAEDPAGMGVFSLAGRDVTIRSYSQAARQGWSAHIPANAWETSRPIAISPDPIANGTSLTIRMPDQWRKTIAGDVASAALHYPLPVMLDGVVQPHSDWLGDAVHVEDWNGTRIGVRRRTASHIRHKDEGLNFHGVTIPCRLPQVSEVDGGSTWCARVDIVNAPDIQLVLPARKEVVETNGIEALRLAVERAIYRAIAAQGSHRLAFGAWARAREIGVILPEAAAHLQSWTASAADHYRNYDSSAPVDDQAMVIVEDLDPLVAQPFQRVVAGHNPFGGPLVETEAAFEGYGWDDRLARVETIAFEIVQGDRRFTVTDEQEAPPEAKDGWVDAITVQASVSRSGATLAVPCVADVAFGPDQFWCNSGEQTRVFVRRGASLSADDVADLFENAVFCPSYDAGADSYDTQQERFERCAAERIIGLLEGSDAALESRLRGLMSGHYYLIPDDRSVILKVTREALAIEIAPRQAIASLSG